MMVEVTPDPRPEKTVKLAVRSKPAPSKTTPMTVKEARAAWYAAVSSKRLSAIWTAEDYPQVAAGEKLQFQLHHPISRQECRKHGAPEWDPRNGVPVTVRRHAEHHSRKNPIRRDELPDEVYAFLTDYPKLQPGFDRVYPLASSTELAFKDLNV